MQVAWGQAPPDVQAEQMIDNNPSQGTTVDPYNATSAFAATAIRRHRSTARVSAAVCSLLCFLCCLIVQIIK
jgi:hypothetical protein